jgi:uncharacterized protein YcbX
LKSAGRIGVDECSVDEMGIEWDRRWRLVDGDGRFMSQRTHPGMVLLLVSVTPEHIDGREFFTWHDDRYGVDFGAGPAAWFATSSVRAVA